MSRLKTFLKIAQELEAKRVAWFDRNGDDGAIWFRIGSYDAMASAKAFHHAQETEAEFVKAKIRCRFDMDRQSFQVLMRVPGIYKGGAK